MMKLTYEQYLDKIYGCWLGKCVIGTLGAPYEGMKQLNKLEFEPKMIEEMLPNDDLDLQVLWLSVLEEKGTSINGEHLAKCFFEKNIKWPGEYAYFRRNYARGIRPPYTGIYENVFYKEGMGCPIRAEIWGMILPGNPQIAADLSEIDSTLDHVGDSVYFERFFTAMVSCAFFEDDLQLIINEGLKQVPNDSKAYSLIKDVIAWNKEIDDVLVIRSYIIGKYGHCDCTNVFQNIGLTLLALLRSENNPIKAGSIACNLGFDTDCTAGNAGSLLGVILGAKKLQEFGIKPNCKFKLNLRYSRATDDVFDLSVDTAKVGVHFLKSNYNGAINCVDIDDINDSLLDEKMDDVEILNYYDVSPYIAPNESVEVRFVLKNNTSNCIELKLETISPNDFSFSIEQERIVLNAFESKTIMGRVSCFVKDYLSETNLFTLKAISDKNKQYNREFGIVGKRATLWYGPFWENNINIDLNAENGKYKYCYGNIFTGVDVNDRVDNMRRYQINMVTDFDKKYLFRKDFEVSNANGLLYEYSPKAVYLNSDTFSINEFSSFKGPAVYYVKQTIKFPKKQRVCFFIGHNYSFEIYMDNKMILNKKLVENFTPENAHYYHLILEEGEHEFIYKLDAPTGDANFGFIINIDDETGQYPHSYTATKIYNITK